MTDYSPFCKRKAVAWRGENWWGEGNGDETAFICMRSTYFVNSQTLTNAYKALLSFDRDAQEKEAISR